MINKVDFIKLVTKKELVIKKMCKTKKKLRLKI